MLLLVKMPVDPEAEEAEVTGKIYISITTTSPSPIKLTTTLIRGRRDGRSANGTLTLRRSSTTPLSQTSQTFPHENSIHSPPEAAYEIEPSPARYTKDRLLSLYRPNTNADTSRLFMQGWNPGHMSNGSSRAWGKNNENHVPQEPGACWNPTGESKPFGHQDLTADEKEVRFLLLSC